MTVVVTAKTPRVHRFTTQVYQTRKYSEEAQKEFGNDLALVDWNEARGLTPSETADRVNFVLQYLYDKHFPLRTVKTRSCDPPWLTKRIKRYIRNRRREFARSGRSERWKRKRDKCEELIREAKKRYFDKVKRRVKEAGNTKCYYQAVNLMNCQDVPTRWLIQNMFPHLTDQEIAEKAAAFFNEISQEFQSLERPIPDNLVYNGPEMYQISAKLKAMKKPKSTVHGDIDPRLVTAHADLLAIPLHIIFVQVYTQLEWPLLWSTETVTLIPKVAVPGSLSQLRNLSCTPLFSKCLESFILDELKKNVVLGRAQFGGIKGTSVNHFLIETWNEVMECLEDPSAAASLMSIDFEKAFNRMSHQSCLKALEEMNADSQSISLVHAFLFNRSMTVRVGKNYSAPRLVPGGSPQGSILGNFLFCVATDKLGAAGNNHSSSSVLSTSASTISFGGNGVSVSDISSESRELMSPISRPTTASPSPLNDSLLRDLSTSSSDSSVNFQYFRKNHARIDDTVLSERCSQSVIDAYMGVPEGWTDRPLSVKVYIDDVNNIEKVKQVNAVSVISEARTVILPHAIKSERNFAAIKEMAERDGMKVNAQKTQLLCISTNNQCTVQSYIRTQNEEEIKSTDELKILGFWFGNKPNAAVHVDKLQKKFRSRLWSLRHLKKSGMSASGLLVVYCSVLRPVLDFACPSYHPLLTQNQKHSLESLQKKALKIVYGPGISYQEAIAVANISTLEDRRETLTKQFALATSKNPRYSDGWFPKKPTRTHNTRNIRPYVEVIPKTERMKKNPITYMRKILNDLA